ncbi:MAG: hypothetical protein H0T88_11710 [Lysobacter sp.]|nr:hypothetical protein [Lysobacter sp.]
MNTPIIAVYAEGVMYPTTASQSVHTTIYQLQKSGFNTPILGLFHVGRDYDITPAQITGDIYYNDTLVISQGSYVGDSSWPGLIGSMIGGGVTKVCASFGGGGVLDFQTLKRIYEGNGNSYAGTNLLANLNVLRHTFPSISVIDMDCEETYDQPSFVAFCQLLIALGFQISFCPYTWQDFWTGSLAKLNASNPDKVVWWNLQAYDGGAGNEPGQWAAAIGTAIPGFATAGYIVVGDWTNDSPSEVKNLLRGFSNEPSLGGGFMWTLDDMISAGTLDAYGSAIKAGLGVGTDSGAIVA